MKTATQNQWLEFQATGLLWWTNRILHTFGWSIVYVYDSETGDLLDVLPLRTSSLGFSQADDAVGLSKFHHLLREQTSMKRFKAEEIGRTMFFATDRHEILLENSVGDRTWFRGPRALRSARLALRIAGQATEESGPNCGAALAESLANDGAPGFQVPAAHRLILDRLYAEVDAMPGDLLEGSS